MTGKNKSQTKKTEKKKVGRPSKYTPELAERFLTELATSSKGVITLCRENDDFPDEKTIYTWMHKNRSFHQKYLEAKASQANYLAEEALMLADEKITYIDGEGNERVDPGAVAWQRLRANERHWAAARLAPNIYGERKAKEEESSNTEEIQRQIIELQEKLLKKNEKEY